MQGTWHHQRAYYRCRFPNEYPIANNVIIVWQVRA
jgi:hypothetical protein